MAAEQDGIGIVEAKCKKCGFVAYGADQKEVDSLKCLLCGEIVGLALKQFPDKDETPSAVHPEAVTGMSSPDIDESKISRMRKLGDAARETMKSLFTIEVYKCLMLTLIAAALIGIYLKTPTPFTLDHLRNKAVSIGEIPLVHVRSGSMDVNVENTVTVDGSVTVDGNVDIGNTVEVEGSVRINRW